MSEEVEAHLGMRLEEITFTDLQLGLPDPTQGKSGTNQGNCRTYTFIPSASAIHSSEAENSEKVASMKAKMSPVEANLSMRLEEITKLRLGPPGETQRKSGIKRQVYNIIDLNLSASATSPSKAENSPVDGRVRAKDEDSGTAKPLAVKKSRIERCKYVKVAVDGAPYLRKIDLKAYNSYDHLLTALDRSFYIGNYASERRIIDPVNAFDFLLTYEDEDGKSVLVGDDPWETFVQSCEQLRFMKISEGARLGPPIQAVFKGSI